MTKWLDKYEQFLLKNANQITTIESGLRNLSFILPGRYQNAEVVSESLYSILQIIGMYHDRILVKANQKNEKLSAHNRYVQTMSSHYTLYRSISLLLNIGRCTELLTEMAVMNNDKQRKSRNHFKAVMGIEAIKSLLRLTLLFVYKRPVLTSPVIQRQLDGNESQDPKNIPKNYKMKRTGMELPPIPVNCRDYLNEKVIMVEDVKGPMDLLHVLNFQGFIAEILYAARPAVYAYLIYRCNRHVEKPQSFINRWMPWVVGLSIDYTSTHLLVENYRQNLPMGLRSLTQLEAQEIAERRSSLSWYLLRGPMYRRISRPIMQKAVHMLDLPGIGLFGSLIEDYMYLFDNYYFSSASL